VKAGAEAIVALFPGMAGAAVVIEKLLSGRIAIGCESRGCKNR
jgi:hypothetical protein